ncbi:MAG: DUF5060 domain-containing protein [Opitutaceae bacterium]
MAPLFRRSLVGGFALCAAVASCEAQSLRVEVLAQPRLWQRSEWRVDGVPATANPFDPDVLRVDATITTPSGRVLSVPAFWFQDYHRALVEGVQILTPSGSPEWRLRYTPDEPGTYALALAATGADVAPHSSESLSFTVPPASVATGSAGWVRVAPDQQSLETGPGRALRLIGSNVCWNGPRGTYDFDAWFAALHAAGGNFARLWFAPWAMGLEHKPGTLNRYDLADAWHADYVLDLAERSGIYVLISLDHHGMFMANDPAWGGSNNHWRRNSPYAAENGGPCAHPNEFFTRDDARRLYQKRLRYLIARYGSSPHLLSWQFFNEIDNSYVPRSTLVGADVVAWHRDMGRWLKAHDPYRHLVSTSLTGASDRPEYWTLPEMDFTVYHSYGEADPLRSVAALSADFVRRYRKPVMIGEIGTNHLSWTIANDPYLRGFRQGLWGGVLGGSVGTSMSWWWESIHQDQAYPFYTVIRDLMASAGWDQGGWSPATFDETGPAPADLGEAVASGEPFSAGVPLNQLRLNRVPGEAAFAHALAVERAAERLSSYLHGTRNPQLQQHARITAWFAPGARLLVRVNSVASDADLLVRIDGAESLRVLLVNKDGLATLNDEIDREFTVDVPAGKHRIEIAHTGSDWLNLKSLRLERLRPSSFAGGWDFVTEAVGLQRDGAAVVYVRSPQVAWPAGALRYRPPTVHGATVVLRHPFAGVRRVVWYDPRTGQTLTSGTVTPEGDRLRLAVPDFNEDAVAVLTRE